MPLRVVITTTLNHNLFRAKLEPLVRARDDLEVVVVSDQPGPAIERVQWVWPRGVLRMLGRIGARLLLLRREIRDSHTRLVMAYNVVPHGIFAERLARKRGIPVYLHFIGGPGEIRFAQNPAVSDNRLVQRSRNRERLERWACDAARRADKLFVPGRNTAQFLVSEGFARERLVRLHSAVDPGRFFVVSRDRDFDVVVSAQLRERKRPLFALRVLAEIRRMRPTARFCWLGDGPLHHEFEAARRDLQLQDVLDWRATDEVAPFYQRAKVFLLCSVNEGLSLACMEAMACGVVPVTADVGDMSEVVRPEETGVLMSADARVSDYAAAVLRYLDHPNLWQTHSTASSELIRREHGYDSVTALWRELLRELA